VGLVTLDVAVLLGVDLPRATALGVVMLAVVVQVALVLNLRQ